LWQHKLHLKPSSNAKAAGAVVAMPPLLSLLPVPFEVVEAALPEQRLGS